MSEEDKELKRIKIEQNRNKRKLKSILNEKASWGDDQEQTKKVIKVKEEWSPGSTSSPMETQSESSCDDYHTPERLRHITSDSPVVEIISALTQSPQEGSQVIQKVMETQSDALSVMSRIIQEPSQALILVSHLIKNPSDGMMIISKMISSPLDALSVFTQFMASPTDALQIIFKIMSSPKDVLEFMAELTKSPKDALEIMSKFLSPTGDTMASLNRIMTQDAENEMIKSMLDVSSVDSPNSSIASPSSFQSMASKSPQTVPSNDYDANNNDYHQNTTKLLHEVTQDVNSWAKSPFHDTSIDSIINEAIKLEYETPQMVSHMQSPNRELNKVEVMKIQELLDSNKALYAPVDEDLSSLVLGDCQLKAEPGVDPMLLKVINLTAIAIRRLIKMSKKISGFKKMCQEDQIALLKV